MFYPKSDIFSQDWLDVIFEGRNKQYGAYVLRKNASKQATLALFVASSVFVISLLAPVVKNRWFPKPLPESVNPFEKERIVELMPPPPIDKSAPEPLAPAPPVPRVSQVRMPPPKVVSADQVTEEPPSAAALKLVNPGPETIEGNPDAVIHIDVPAGLGQIDAGITESADADKPFRQVEIAPSFPGGMEAFLMYVQKNYRYPPQAIEQGVKGKVILTFIVERDGSLTDIKIVRDLKFGTGDEAVRLLRASPKWSPGIQNGRTVRVAYTLPIGLNIRQ